MQNINNPNKTFIILLSHKWKLKYQALSYWNRPFLQCYIFPSYCCCKTIHQSVPFWKTNQKYALSNTNRSYLRLNPPNTHPLEVCFSLTQVQARYNWLAKTPTHSPQSCKQEPHAKQWGDTLADIEVGGHIKREVNVHFFPKARGLNAGIQLKIVWKKFCLHRW